MKLWNLAAALGVMAAAFACTTTPGSSEDQLCTPGAFVFCRCAGDRSAGTKECSEDGKSFASCRTKASGECVGGEIDDDRTGQPVDGDGIPTGPQPIDSKNVIELCPGKTVSPLNGKEMKLEGETTLATQDRTGRAGACAGGNGANDHVYHLAFADSGSLEVKVTGEGGLVPLAYIRKDCEDVESQVACAPPTANNIASARVSVTAKQPYFLVVDGSSGSVGKYTVTLKLTAGSFCGDGKIDRNEACDDGNKESDSDGCSNDCQKVTGNPPSGGACPGHPVDVWEGRTVTGVGSTTPYGSAWNAPSSGCSGSSNDYQDHVYAVTAHATGTLKVALSAPPSGTLANHMLVARSTCDNAATQKACVNDFGSGTAGTESLSVSVTEGETIYVAVDGGGVTSNKGDYGISFKIEAP